MRRCVDSAVQRPQRRLPHRHGAFCAVFLCFWLQSKAPGAHYSWLYSNLAAALACFAIQLLAAQRDFRCLVCSSDWRNRVLPQSTGSGNTNVCTRSVRPLQIDFCPESAAAPAPAPAVASAPAVAAQAPAPVDAPAPATPSPMESPAPNNPVAAPTESSAFEGSAAGEGSAAAAGSEATSEINPSGATAIAGYALAATFALAAIVAL